MSLGGGCYVGRSVVVGKGDGRVGAFVGLWVSWCVWDILVLTGR